MLLLLGITAGFGGVRPSVSDGSEPDTVSSPELDSLASFELHICRPGRQVREGRRGTEDQARFAGVCERAPPARYAARGRVHPQGVYRMDAELRARILLPAQHQRGKYPFRPHTNRHNLYFRSGNRAVRRCGRTTHTRRGSRLRTVRPERQTGKGARRDRTERRRWKTDRGRSVGKRNGPQGRKV